MGIVTVKEVAKLLKVSHSTLYKLAANGKVPAVRIGDSWRFDMDEITKWIDSNKVAKKGDDMNHQSME